MLLHLPSGDVYSARPGVVGESADYRAFFIVFGGRSCLRARQVMCLRAFLAMVGVFLLAPSLRAQPFAVELDGFASFSSLSPFSDASTVFDPWVAIDDP